jgi:hypothetical protein
VDEAFLLTEQFGLFSVMQVYRHHACLCGEANIAFSRIASSIMSEGMEVPMMEPMQILH